MRSDRDGEENGRTRDKFKTERKDSINEKMDITIKGTSSRATWSQEFTDFALVVKSELSCGEEWELKCHKHVLAENSPVFKAMLKTDYAETKTSQMWIEDFKEETVILFLKYIYTPVRDVDAVKLMRAALGPKKYIFTRKFDTEKISLDLLKMSHKYEVEDLQMDCAEYLGENLSDDNVVETWLEAKKMDIENLYYKALRHLIYKRPRDSGSFLNVPGFPEIFNSLEKSMQDFLRALSIKAGIEM